MRGAVASLIRCLHTSKLRADQGLSDRQLLDRYIFHHEEAAFEALVERHAQLVFSVCRRMLANIPDAEDAFQATFLVLLRKASSVGRGGSLGNWLYGVAYRTALEARTAAARRRQKEAQVPPSAQPVPDDAMRELLPLLDQELSLLPDKYRAPVVLCELEGKTRKEAAQLLGWPEGTVAGRLARARAMLARRLARYSPVSASASLAAVLHESQVSAAVPAALVTNSARAAHMAPAHVLALVEGVVKTMLLHKLRVGFCVILGIALLAPAGALLARWTFADEPRPDQPDANAKAATRPESKPKDAPAAGYYWLVEPQQGRGSPWSVGRVDGKGVVVLEEKDKEDALLLTVAHPAPTNRAGLVEYRPVAIDDKGNRHVLELVCGGGAANVAMNRFRLDPKKLPADKVKRLGVEILTPEGVQLIARQAMARAKKDAVEVLPPAEVGEKYDFSLTTLDARTVRSGDFKGKVVLLDCWSCT